MLLNRKFKVAVLNYPLMKPDMKLEHNEYFRLDYVNSDQWKVPLYIHIPFCDKICKFCVYNRKLPDKSGGIVQQYVEALKKEIKMYGKYQYIKNMDIGAVFLGGGTPTCLSSIQLEEIIKHCREYLPLSKDTEITVECNIINADEEKIHRLSQLGVKRISAGIQSLNQKYRTILGLNKSVEDAIKWINMVKEYPFTDLAIDLLYGLPGQTIGEWIKDLKTALALPIDHFSLYELIVLAGSKLYEEMNENKLPKCAKGEKLYNMFVESDKLLKESNFEHHIMPEYNAPEKKAQFWELTYDGYGDNLSLGASSFGYINGVTYQNISESRDYIAKIEEGLFPIEMSSDRISFEQLMERTMVLGFRRGYVNKNIFKQQYGKEIKEQFSHILEPLISMGYVLEDQENYRLTPKGEYCQGDVSVRFMETTFGKTSSLKKQIAIGKHILPQYVK